MRPLASIFVLALAACGKAPTPAGTLTARLAADPALGTTFTTEDGWSLKFDHVVVAVSAVGVTGVTSPPQTKLVELLDAGTVDLGSNTSAEPKSYDGFSLTLSRGSTDDNLNVAIDVVNRLGPRGLYVSGTASRQSTVQSFQLAVSGGLAFTACQPAVTVASGATANVDFRVSAQKLFADDTGKLRFDAWGASDASPLDGTVTVTEAQALMTSMLPAAHYGMTTGSLYAVFEKRSLGVVGLGDSGSCTGAQK